MKENLLISKSDFDGVRQVSRHCSFDNLTPYIRERQFLDLSELLGESFYYNVVTNDCDGTYDDLLDGSEYTDCLDNTRFHYGIKRALIHFAYAAYVMESGYVSTPHGMVQKLNQDSVPVPIAELRNLHDRNRRIGQDYMSGVLDYVCHNTDTYTLFTKQCDCSCGDKEKRTTRNTSFKFIRGTSSATDSDIRCCPNE